MILAAFDLATATGVCDGAVGGKPRLFSWFLDDAGPGRPQRLLALREFLVRYFATQPCDAVVYEAPMNLAIMARIGAQEATVAFLRGAVGVLEMTCAEHGKPVEGLNVQDARSSVLGWRTNRIKPLVVRTSRGGKTALVEQGTKARVMAEIARLGVAPQTADEADAAVLWFYACALQNPRLAVAMTPLFQRPLDVDGATRC